MTDENALRHAFRKSVPKSNERREHRASRTRAAALSPMRILMQLLLVPIVTISLTVTIYVRTSPYEQNDALRHLAALAGCDTARTMGLAPAFEGELGYHKRNDPDGDGIACASAARALTHSQPAAPAAPVPVTPDTRQTSGAKFIKPTN